jgi:hypothetical protein
MKDISREVLDKIKKEGIVPRPKRYFILRRSTVWILFCFSIILGSIAGSTLIFRVKNAEWDLFHHFKGNLLDFLLIYTPYFWGIFMIFFSVVAYYYFRQTQGGYRYRAITIVALSLLISVAAGMGMYSAGISERMETVFEEKLPFYHGVSFHSRKVWMSPDKGLLAGRISDVTTNGSFRLDDLDGNEWHINAEGTIWRGRLTPSTGLEIKLIGTRIGPNSFRANEVRPWHGRKKRGAMNRNN